VFQKELYNFERVYRFIQRTYTAYIYSYVYKAHEPHSDTLSCGNFYNCWESSQQAANLSKVREYNKLFKERNLFTNMCSYFRVKQDARNVVKMSELRPHEPNSDSGYIFIPMLCNVLSVGAGNLQK
jgi:hypothetical protein